MSELIDTSKEEEKLKKRNKRRERELSDIRRILQLPEGRRFYWRVLEKGGVFRDPYADTNTNGTNYNLGRQSISRDFLNDLLEAKSDGLAQLQDEYRAEQESERLAEEMTQKKPGELS